MSDGPFRESGKKNPLFKGYGNCILYESIAAIDISGMSVNVFLKNGSIVSSSWNGIPPEEGQKSSKEFYKAITSLWEEWLS